MSLVIEVISDIVCPWCFIGKRRLEAALALYAEAEPDAEPPTVLWLPFQLNPDMPDTGMARDAYLAAKFGERQSDIMERMAHEGEREGIYFEFDRIAQQPNTAKAHALIDRAAACELQDAVVEALFNAYFVHGEDLSNDAVLERIASDEGLPADEIEAALRDENTLVAVREADAHAREMGVSGVPFFVLNRQLAVSGAHPADTLLAAMLKASAE
jgi:predicted DsbA family dithiol-disulfide isomerase